MINHVLRQTHLRFIRFLVDVLNKKCIILIIELHIPLSFFSWEISLENVFLKLLILFFRLLVKGKKNIFLINKTYNKKLFADYGQSVKKDIKIDT